MVRRSFLFCALLPVLAPVLFATGAEAGFENISCKGERSEATWIRLGDGSGFLVTARFRDEWSVVNVPAETEIRRGADYTEFKMLASPVADGSIEFLTVQFPAAGNRGRMAHSREYTYLDDYPPRVTEEEMECEANAQEGLAATAEVVSGLVHTLSDDRIELVMPDRSVRGLPLDRPVTVIFDGYDMAGTSVLGRGVPAEILLDAAGKILLIHATRDRARRVVPAGFDLVCQPVDPARPFKVWLVYETWAGANRNFMRMIETDSTRSWVGEALTLTPRTDEQGIEMPFPFARYSARGPALYQALNVDFQQSASSWSGTYRRVAREFTGAVPVTCAKP